MSDELELLRARIEEIDAAIIQLLGQRFAQVRQLGRHKARAGLPVIDAGREAELRALYRAAAEREGLDPTLVLGVFEAVLRHSRAEQEAQARRPRTA